MNKRRIYYWVRIKSDDEWKMGYLLSTINAMVIDGVLWRQDQIHLMIEVPYPDDSRYKREGS